LTNDLVRARTEERADALAENPIAQKRYFKARSIMNIGINCNIGTDDLFVYSHKTDLVALVLASGVPFYQTSKNPTTGGASLQKYELVLSRNIGTRTLPNLLLQAEAEDAKAAGVEVLHFLLSIGLTNNPFPFAARVVVKFFATPAAYYGAIKFKYTDFGNISFGTCIKGTTITVLSEILIRRRVTVIEHNGLQGAAGHYVPVPYSDKIPLSDVLGAPPTKSARTAQGPKYNRNAVREKWFEDFLWLRKTSNGKYFFCCACFGLPMHRGSDQFALGTVFIEKARQDKMATHNASKKHLYCLALSQRDSEKARNISAARLNVSITSKFDSLEAVKSKWTDLTVASDLLGQAVRVNGSRAKINKLVSPQGTALMQEKFELLFSNKDVAQFSRDEVILMLNEEKLDDLEKQVDWQHFVALTQWRLCATFHLVSDVSYELERFSLACQRDNNSISDIRRSVDRVYVGLERMKHENGGSLRSFYENYNDETETFMDLNMENVEDGKAAFESDRPLLLNSVITFVKAKFDVVLDHPVLRAAQAFEQKLWPIHDDDALDAFGNNDIRLLAKHFSGLDCMYNFNLDEAMRQWRSLKRETRRLPFFGSCDYVQFWEHIATHYDTGDLTGYSEILILALVILLIILDTSCCERSFALMNRIHTYLRNRLGVATLNNLMCICSLGPPIMNFDPKPILAKWLEEPFMQKNGRGRSLQGKLNALIAAGSS
jgi:hypothetical protein